MITSVRKNIAITCTQEQLVAPAKALADVLALPLLKYPIQNINGENQYRYLLAVTPDPLGYHLQLEFPDENLNPVLVDFLGQKIQYRKNFGGGRQQPIARAIGLKRGYVPTVLDGTAGLGKDAFVLASLNCKVTMCERHPVIHALLADGLRRLDLASSENRNNPVFQSLVNQASHDFLEHSKDSFDIIYLDPMYPHRTKSALVKKEMRILRNLVGDDMDFDNVLTVALAVAKNRVVIKRPKTAPPIGVNPPSHSIESKKTRFDVYLTNLGKG